jgi:alpha-D-xyloside xylohydrolase
MRPLLLEFPEDEAAWDVDDQFMFGSDVLVAPVTGLGERQRSVYLPDGATWTHTDSQTRYKGGARITVDAPLNRIPLFVRDDAPTPLSLEEPA